MSGQLMFMAGVGLLLTPYIIYVFSGEVRDVRRQYPFLGFEFVMDYRGLLRQIARRGNITVDVPTKIPNLGRMASLSDSGKS